MTPTALKAKIQEMITVYNSKSLRFRVSDNLYRAKRLSRYTKRNWAPILSPQMDYDINILMYTQQDKEVQDYCPDKIKQREIFRLKIFLKTMPRMIREIGCLILRQNVSGVDLFRRPLFALSIYSFLSHRFKFTHVRKIFLMILKDLCLHVEI